MELATVIASCKIHTCTQVLVVLVVYISVWVLLAVGLGGVLAFYLQTQIFCNHRTGEALVGSSVCLYYTDTGNSDRTVKLVPTVSENSNWNGNCGIITMTTVEFVPTVSENSNWNGNHGQTSVHPNMTDL